MQIAVLTPGGSKERDSFVAPAILNRKKAHGWTAHITSSTPEMTPKNGVSATGQWSLKFVAQANAVLIGSEMMIRKIATDGEIVRRIKLDPARQLIGAQCSSSPVPAKLDLLRSLAACTDPTTKPWDVDAGVESVRAPFVAHENVAPIGEKEAYPEPAVSLPSPSLGLHAQTA